MHGSHHYFLHDFCLFGWLVVVVVVVVVVFAACAKAVYVKYMEKT